MEINLILKSLTDDGEGRVAEESEHEHPVDVFVRRQQHGNDHTEVAEVQQVRLFNRNEEEDDQENQSHDVLHEPANVLEGQQHEIGHFVLEAGALAVAALGLDRLDRNELLDVPGANVPEQKQHDEHGDVDQHSPLPSLFELELDRVRVFGVGVFVVVEAEPLEEAQRLLDVVREDGHEGEVEQDLDDDVNQASGYFPKSGRAKRSFWGK